MLTHKTCNYSGRKPYERIALYTILSGLLAAAACNNEKPTPATSPAEKDVSVAPATLTWDVVKEYPHDPAAFTEGLEYKDGALFESTGQYGSSDIRKVDLGTGQVISSTKMDAKYFGEGLTVLNGKVYQLTYREGKGFVYNANTLKPESTFTFNAPEGWGMTNNGTNLIFDDGTNIFHFIDPNTYKEVKQLAVTDEHGNVNDINEPELMNGFIYANQWKTDLILKIDTATGKVVGRADLSDLRQRYGIPPASGRRNTPDVLNGIAYDATNNRIFVTGKNWPKLFEIKLSN
jgi:glutamine cyclotransferase